MNTDNITSVTKRPSKAFYKQHHAALLTYLYQQVRKSSAVPVVVRICIHRASSAL